jgi:hypothetical protein
LGGADTAENLRLHCAERIQLTHSRF